MDETALAHTVTEIQEALAIESEQKGWMDLLRDDHVRSRRRVALACLLNACQAGLAHVRLPPNMVPICLLWDVVYH